MAIRIVVLGAGFGGLEVSTRISQALGANVEVTLIERNDAFVFGYSKLDVLFGRATLEEVRLSYRTFTTPEVRLVRATVVAIDPIARRVTTDVRTYDCEYLVIALGAEYDLSATPGLTEATEFYSVAGAQRLHPMLSAFDRGHALIGVCGAPYKCPPAPSECALLLHDFLVRQGVRDLCEISLVIPLPTPVPPSPDTSRALLAAFAERGIKFMGNRKVVRLDPTTQTAVLDDNSQIRYDLFLGVPAHRAPRVLDNTGLVHDGWVRVDPKTLQTDFEGVYAIGDVANTGVPKAGVFAESAALAVAESLIARVRGKGAGGINTGMGSCYIEFGEDKVARVDIDFLSGLKPAGAFHEPSSALQLEKEQFGATRRERWFKA